MPPYIGIINRIYKSHREITVDFRFQDRERLGIDLSKLQDSIVPAASTLLNAKPQLNVQWQQKMQDHSTIDGGEQGHDFRVIPRDVPLAIGITIVPVAYFGVLVTTKSVDTINNFYAAQLQRLYEELKPVHQEEISLFIIEFIQSTSLGHLQRLCREIRQKRICTLFDLGTYLEEYHDKTYKKYALNLKDLFCSEEDGQVYELVLETFRLISHTEKHVLIRARDYMMDPSQKIEHLNQVYTLVIRL